MRAGVKSTASAYARMMQSRWRGCRGAAIPPAGSGRPALDTPRRGSCPCVDAPSELNRFAVMVDSDLSKSGPPGVERGSLKHWIRLFPPNDQSCPPRSLRMTPLRQRMIDDMQLRNLAARTQKNYIAHVAAFAKYFGKSPTELDIEAVRQYQLYLLNQRKLSPESVNQYVSSVKFLYLITLEMPWTSEYFPRAHKLPVVLSQEEVLAFFDHIPSLKYRAALMVCYGAGLRISEAVALKVSD